MLIFGCLVILPRTSRVQNLTDLLANLFADATSEYHSSYSGESETKKRSTLLICWMMFYEIFN